MQIHKNFKLNGKSFSTSVSLLEFVKEKLPEHFNFLKEYFNNSNTIIVSTSGSTGKPKKIMIEKSKMLNSAQATADFFHLSTQTTALHCLSSHHIAGKMMWVRAIYLGWHIDVVSVDSSPLEHITANYDFVAMVPLQVENSLKELKRIKQLIIGGAPISFLLEKALKRQATKSYQTYGMTETITHIAVKEIGNDTSYYEALPSVSLFVDNRDCLVIKAPKVAKETIITNDIVRLVNKNEFEWLGRYDNVINSGGVKLFPETIERKLTPFISNSFIIIGIPDEKLGEKLVLIVEAQNPIKDIEKYLLKANLSKFEKPKTIFFLNEFVRTSNGKIKRSDAILKINKKNL